MKTIKMLLFSTCVTTLLILYGTILYSQESSSGIIPDSTESQEFKNIRPDTGSVVPTSKRSAVSEGEIILEEIKIEAVVETPSVGIVPKRISPEFGQMEFMDRSFENELKAVPKESMLINNELKGVHKIKKDNRQLYEKESK